MSITDRRSITLTGPQLDYLHRESERLGITISDVIRRIIDIHRDAGRSIGDSPKAMRRGRPKTATRK